jgi:hypothetical protein
MLRELGTLYDKGKLGKLPKGMARTAAIDALKERLAAPPPWKLVDVFSY